MNLQRQRHAEAGFTLIELLVVVIVIGILASIAIPIFYKQRERGWDAAVRSDLRNAATAQETYLTESSPGPFATTVAELRDVGFRPSTGGNYFGGVFTMTVTADASNSYCLTARSRTGTYMGLSSQLGWVAKATPIAAATCI
jgi:type IV pilus assembly protein PilA